MNRDTVMITEILKLHNDSEITVTVMVGRSGYVEPSLLKPKRQLMRVLAIWTTRIPEKYISS